MFSYYRKLSNLQQITNPPWALVFPVLKSNESIYFIETLGESKFSV